MLKQRVLGAIVGLIVLIGLLTLNTFLSTSGINNDSLALLFIVIIMAGRSAYEASRVLKNRYPGAGKLNGVYAALIIPFIVHAVRPWMSPYADQPVMGNIGLFIDTIGAAGCLMALFLDAWSDIEKRGKDGLKENLIIIPIGFYIGIAVSSLLLLGTSQQYISVIIYIFIMVFVFDTSCYFVGTAIKGKKLCPKISPNKTWAGTIGGIFFTTLASLLFYIVPSSGDFLALNTIITKPLYFILTGLVIAIAAQCGDLLESSYKRWGEVKDAGKLIPGHGGFLDRFDSLFLAAPVFYILFMFIIR